MTTIEKNILDALVELEDTIRVLPTANPKPSLLPLFARIDEFARQLPKETDPRLLHYLGKKSYEKALQWLQGRHTEIQKGGCRS